MMKHTRWIVGLLGVGFACASNASAQASNGSPIEIGMGALFARRTTDQTFGPIRTSVDQNLVQLPVAMIRVGFFVTDMVQLEPALGFLYQSGTGSHGTQTLFDIGVPIDLQTDRSKANWYVRPLVGFAHLTSSVNGNGGGSTSATQVSFGGGVGVRVPIDRRFATRFEANYRHGNDNDNFGSYNQFGFSQDFHFSHDNC
jgi:hypothetical protein